MKLFSKSKPRFVVYCTEAEQKSAKLKAPSLGLKTANQFAASAIRKALAKGGS